MSKTCFKYLLPVALLLAWSVQADLYKGVDSEGNIIYSDKPFGDSKQIIPPSLTIIDPPKIKAKEEASPEASEDENIADFKYSDFDIVSPKDNQTIRNDPNPTISLHLKPGLNTAEGHTIWLLMDKQPLIKSSRELTLHIGYVNRGAHLLQAQVRDNTGKTVARTRTVVIHVKHATVSK